MTILNSVEVMDTNVILLVVFLVMHVVSLSMVFISAHEEWKLYISLLLAAAAVACIVLSITTANGTTFSSNSGRYKHECTIEEDVSFVEIASKYDVVEQRGDIWVLEDKKNE